MTAPEQYKPGDVVRLLTGGPAMTVEAVTTTHVMCVWFSGAADAWTGPLRGEFRYQTVRNVTARGGVEPRGDK